MALAVVCMAMLMNVLDTSVVNVALPAMQRDLGFSQANLTWVVDAYLITFGSFLLMAGRIGDLVGRKRVFLVGVAIFTSASLLCGIADSQGLLVGARFLQGFGAAVSSSVIIALIVIEFPRPDDRAKAMSAYILVSVAGGSLGLLLGGVLTEAISWHWIFIVNIPIGLASFVAGRALLDADEGQGLGEGVDVLGSVLVTLALMIAIYALVKVPEEGWGSASTLGWGAVALALLAAFFALEARVANPIMPLRIFRVTGLLWSSVVRGCISAAVSSVFFVTALSLVHVHRFDPVETGLAFMPMTVAVGVMSSGVTSKLLARYGALRLVPIGMTMVLGGLLLLASGDEHTAYIPSMFVALTIFGIGVTLGLIPLLTIAMEHVPAPDAGLGSGVVNVSLQIAGALGLALYSTIAAKHTSTLRADGHPIGQALAAGFRVAYLTAAVVVAGGLAFVLAMLWRRRASPAAETEAREPAAA
jgi:EmrB/QacA subfamily drug resistance transporter